MKKTLTIAVTLSLLAWCALQPSQSSDPITLQPASIQLLYSATGQTLTQRGEQYNCDAVINAGYFGYDQEWKYIPAWLRHHDGTHLSHSNLRDPNLVHTVDILNHTKKWMIHPRMIEYDEDYEDQGVSWFSAWPLLISQWQVMTGITQDISHRQDHHPRTILLQNHRTNDISFVIFPHPITLSEVAQMVHQTHPQHNAINLDGWPSTAYRSRSRPEQSFRPETTLPLVFCLMDEWKLWSTATYKGGGPLRFATFSAQAPDDAYSQFIPSDIDAIRYRELTEQLFSGQTYYRAELPFDYLTGSTMMYYTITGDNHTYQLTPTDIRSNTDQYTYQLTRDGEVIYHTDQTRVIFDEPIRQFVTQGDDRRLLYDTNEIYRDAKDEEQRNRNPQLIHNSTNLSREWGLTDVFGLHIIRDKIFYFFQKEWSDTISYSYDNHVYETDFESISHGMCCSVGTFNPIITADGTMVFWAMINGQWYYVQARIE